MHYLMVLLFYLSLSEGQTVTFDLSNYNPFNKNTTVLKQQMSLNIGFTDVQVNNIPDSASFFLLQVHSYIGNITLSYNRKFKDNLSIKGTNIGLVSTKHSNATFYLKNFNATSALFVIVIYRENDPIPGGCNLSFNTEIAPYQLISYTDELIMVQSQAPSAPRTTCDKNNIQVEMYHLYLPENNYDESYYFNSLEKMLTVDSIKENSYRVATVEGFYKYRKLYSAYRGVGQVFAIIVTYNNQSSAYVPAISYGCDLYHQYESCNGPVTPHWKLICAFLLILGVFICFFGHKFFRITIYLIGFTLGLFISYIVMSLSDYHLTVAEKTTSAILIGLVYGAIWLFIWWKFGSPIVSVSSTFFLAAFLMASIIYYAGVADLVIFHNNVNFWLSFTSIILTIFIMFTIFTLEGHIFGCSFLGAYATVSALNYYVGGNLQYIIINSFRRIVVPDFNMATIDPPFQILDISQSILWILMTCSGFFYQLKQQRGRSPFPPMRYGSVEEMVEREPLLTDSAVIYSDI